MFDQFKKLFSEPQTLGIILTSGTIGLFVGIGQGTIQRRHGGWPGFFSATITGGVVAVITGLAIDSFVPSETMRMAIIGVCAVVSEDIWAGLKALGLGVRSDPLGFVVRVLDALRGRDPAARALVDASANVLTSNTAPAEPAGNQPAGATGGAK